MDSHHSYQNDDSQYEYSWPDEEDKEQNTYSNNFGDEPSYDHLRSNVISFLIFLISFYQAKAFKVYTVESIEKRVEEKVKEI